ncbi:MAG: hypothetical protein C4324_07745 [Blastocatellia bacterium]
MAEPVATGNRKKRGNAMNGELAAFVDDLKSTHQNNLVSVILYGSAASGEFVPRHSDYNILVTLKKITPGDLRNAHACVREWTRLGHPVPVYFTVKEIQDAADVFPIEFYQMESARRVLFGKDVLADVPISDANLRHQCEYELRSKLLLLRRRYIHASESAERLALLMAESLGGVTALIRAALWLKGIAAGPEKAEIIRRSAAAFGTDAAVFARIQDLRKMENSGKLVLTETNELFAAYLVEIEKLIDNVNNL